MLKGEAKKKYQRDYMRRRRALDPKTKALSMLDQASETLSKASKRLGAVNENMSEVLESMKHKKEKPSGKSQKDVNFDGQEIVMAGVEGAKEALENGESITTTITITGDEELIGPISTKAALYTCPKCFGTGMINADKAGIVAKFCDCASGQRKLTEQKRIYEG